MSVGLIGKKLGMTQLFDESGACIPVTVIQAGPCVVVQRRTTENDGYEAVQLGLVESRPKKNVTQPMAGHFKKADVPPMRVLREFHVASGDELEAGAKLLVNESFSVGDKVTVVGTSIGKGFQGVMKRHNFSGGPASHGSMFKRAPGSIGQSATPSRVFRGQKLPGHMGHARVSTKGLLVVKVDEERNLILVKGAVPGAKGGYLTIRKAGNHG